MAASPRARHRGRQGGVLPFEIQGAIAHLTAANCLDEAGVTNLVWQASDDFVGKWAHTTHRSPRRRHRAR